MKSRVISRLVKSAQGTFDAERLICEGAKVDVPDTPAQGSRSLDGAAERWLEDVADPPTVSRES
jgi:hypothetical protein